MLVPVPMVRPAAGEVVPIPNLPLSKKANLSAAVESWTFKAKPVPVLLAFISNLANGRVVPIPRLPAGIKARLVVPPVWICLTPVAE